MLIEKDIQLITGFLNLNTSHVNVNRTVKKTNCSSWDYLNTSHVNVNRFRWVWIREYNRI